MITINKTMDNMFRITYMNPHGVEQGVATAEFTAIELKTLIKLSDLYFNELYSKDPSLDTMSLGLATKAILRRGVYYAGNEEFEGKTWPEQEQEAARAIYAYLTSTMVESFKDKLKEHGYEV